MDANDPAGASSRDDGGYGINWLTVAYCPKLLPSCCRLNTQPAWFIRSRNRWMAGSNVSTPATKMPAATAKSAQRNGTRIGK